MLPAITILVVSCGLCACVLIFRRKLFTSGYQVRRYLEMVDMGQEAIPVDDHLWYYRTLQKKNINLPIELKEEITKSKGADNMFLNILQVSKTVILITVICIGVFLSISLVLQPENLVVNITAFSGILVAFSGYLIIKELVDNVKHVNEAKASFLERFNGTA